MNFFVFISVACIGTMKSNQIPNNLLLVRYILTRRKRKKSLLKQFNSIEHSGITITPIYAPPMTHQFGSGQGDDNKSLNMSNVSSCRGTMAISTAIEPAIHDL